MNTNKRAYYWIKLNTAYLSNVKFLKLEEKVRYHYIALYLLSCECDAGGLLHQNGVNLTIDDLALLLYTDSNNLDDSINKLLQSDLMESENDGFIISRFIDEQGPQSFGDKVTEQRKRWLETQQKHRKNIKDKEIEKDKRREEIDENIDKEKDSDEIREDIDKDKNRLDKRVIDDNSETFLLTSSLGRIKTEEENEPESDFPF